MESIMERTEIPPLMRSRTFLLVWLGQSLSVIGSGLSGFALVVWLYQRTGAVTQVALLSFFIALPGILISPLAGVIADRWDRRLVMLGCDLGSGLSTLAVALLLYSHQLQIWHVYLCSAILAMLIAVRWPAYSAAITLLVAKRDLGRASGMVETSHGIGQLVAPLLAGILVVTLGIARVVVIDFVTYALAVSTFLLVRFPRPVPSQADEKVRGSLWREAMFGLPYIQARPGLMGLLKVFAVTSFLQGFVMVLAAPFLLSSYSAAVLGTVSSIIGCGMLVGGVLMSAWGGPRRKVVGILGFQAIGALCILLAGGVNSIYVFSVCGFFFFFCQPIINGSSLALWQTKVEPGVQGKVFAMRSLIATAAIPLAYLCAGPLVDHLFQPLMNEGGLLAGSLGTLIGVGKGRGIGLLFSLVGLLGILVSAVAYSSKSVRNVEDDLPDAVVEP